MRPWYKIHLSTLFVLAIVLAGLVFINIPGDRALRESGRFHHGWPYFYFERDGQSRSWWTFTGAVSEFHVGGLLLNLLTMLCIVALVACACELWIRRFGKLWRFSIAAMLAFTAVIAVITGIVVRDIHRCHRQQQALDTLAGLGTVRAMREERKYDWFRSLFGSQFDGTIHRIDVVSAVPTGGRLPDLTALEDLRFLSLEGVTLGAVDIENLATAPKLGTLVLDLRAIRGDPQQALARISELSIRWIHLGLEGDWLNDELLAGLEPDSRIASLAIKSSRVTGGSFQHLSQMKSLEQVWIDGSKVRDWDFSPLAKAPKLKQIVFYRCNLSQRDEDNLLKLWHDGNLHTGTGPDGMSKLVQAFRMQGVVDPADGGQ
jgi:hypothetical protein